MATSRQHVIEIKELSTSTRKELEMLPPLSGECCIYRVPERLRKSNEQHYTPQVVSIGPIHYGKPELRAMEEHKKRYLQDFLKLSRASLEECFELIRNSETRLRNCYAHVVELNSDDFIKMVLVDAAFLVMVFLHNRFNFKSSLSSIDRVFKQQKLILEIRYDMVLLENQLPFFILKELYQLSKIHSILKSDFSRSTIFSDYTFNEETAMTILAYKFLDIWSVIKIPQRNPPAEAEHMLALLRSCLKPTGWDPKRQETKTLSIPRTKELHQAGIKFRVGSEENLFDIKYKDGVLEIPFLSVDDYTELVFRNLQALEICHNLDPLCIDYFIMMQLFTMESTDVEVLIESGVLEIALRNAQAISTTFRELSPGNFVRRYSFGYTDVINGLNAYYAVPWNRWKATLIQKYFKAPWAIFSFIAAILLLILTIVQTVCSILQVN